MTEAEKAVTEGAGRGERSIPAIRLTDAEAGAVEFAGSNSRTYNYYTPKGRRASLYEDVTVDVQPDPDRYLTQGWIYAFADGTKGYSPEWTRMKSSDWHAFRDPNEEWERTIYINNANAERQVQQNIENAKTVNAFATWNENWVDIVAKHVSAWMHPEHGLGMHVFLAANRDAMSNMLNNVIAVNSAHKLRIAQDIALYNLELDEQIPGFDGSVHKEIWLNDPCWQGVRENVERLMTIRDWAEAVFAANVIFEPLVGELIRSQFVMQFSAPHGDFVTPTVFGVAENDYERDLRWTKEAFRVLVEDYQHGEENKRVAQEWLAQWIPYSVSAVRQLQPLWSQAPVKAVRFEDAFDRVKSRFETILSDLQLELPQEVRQEVNL
ncbi:MAG: aromatic/alkene monooxygenase hydroxylase subunit beta [Actinomycetota bacterium]|nr:aromatic/alkene monooxygenase hydroxylase subunit beta [Actinomycetota bacterium]